MKKNYLLLLFPLLLLLSCNYVISPITTTPAVIIGAFDKANKRENWLRYAKMGDVYSQYELAMSYCCGHLEGKIDNKESFRWFCKAAKNGHAKSQVEIAKIYSGEKKLDGLDIKEDKVLAYFWYAMAARRINEDGITGKKRLKGEISQAQMEEAEQLLYNPKTVECGL